MGIILNIGVLRFLGKYRWEIMTKKEKERCKIN